MIKFLQNIDNLKAFLNGLDEEQFLAIVKLITVEINEFCNESNLFELGSIYAEVLEVQIKRGLC